MSPLSEFNPELTERDILELIREDENMMQILRIAEKLRLEQWLIGAGFVRNKIWNHLHGTESATLDATDIDLVYFDPNGNNATQDQTLSKSLQEETGLTWEVVNQTYAHTWNNVAPYASIEDAIARWPETATAIGIRCKNDTLEFIAPYGIFDLVHLIVRPTPVFDDQIEKIRTRVQKKGWHKKWPKLQFTFDL